MARLAATSLVFEFNGDWAHYREWFDEKIASAQTNKDPYAADLTGSLIKFGRGDGYAFYVVTKHDPLTVRHIAIGDAWQAERALIRGLLRDDVRRQLQYEKDMKELFERHQAQRAVKKTAGG
jgi:hypothetical protein